MTYHELYPKAASGEEVEPQLLYTGRVYTCWSCDHRTGFCDNTTGSEVQVCKEDCRVQMLIENWTGIRHRVVAKVPT